MIVVTEDEFLIRNRSLKYISLIILKATLYLFIYYTRLSKQYTIYYYSFYMYSYCLYCITNSHSNESSGMDKRRIGETILYFTIFS